jgi:hypothetical protein
MTQRITNTLSRVTLSFVLVGLFIMAASGATYAQQPATSSQIRPLVAEEVVQSWKDAHPLEYYLALPVNEYVAQAQASYWDNANPMEYYLALPESPNLVHEQLEAEPGVAGGDALPCDQC